MLAGTNRVEAFSDGVFAIVLTILVLELKVPIVAGAGIVDFFGALGGMLPKLGAFAFSFFIVAIFWVNHHHLFNQLARIDTRLVWMNVAFLFFCSLFPFLTAFVGDYLGAAVPVACYAVAMWFASYLIGAMWRRAFLVAGLSNHPLPEKARKKELVSQAVAMGVNTLTIVLSFVFTPGAIGILVIMPWLFILPGWFGKSSRSIEEGT